MNRTIIILAGIALMLLSSVAGAEDGTSGAS